VLQRSGGFARSAHRSALGIDSVVVVPLIARGNVLGAITFVSADVGHPDALGAAMAGRAEELVGSPTTVSAAVAALAADLLATLRNH
jgi:hypothetical protein